MLRQTVAFGLIRAENLPGTIMVSALLIFILMIERFFFALQKEGSKMEGKGRARTTVQGRLQSQVEDRDWWKQRHLFNSFMQLNKQESHESQFL